MSRRRKRPHPSLDCSIILDTNVLCEIFAFGDVIRERTKLPSNEAALRDPGFTSRQLRSRYSNVLAWYFAKNRIVTASLIDEAIATLLRVAPHSDPRVAALTGAIVHVVKPRVFRGWSDKGIANLPPNLRGNAADAVILDVAGAHGDTVITNEGLGLDGFDDDPRKMRARAKARGIKLMSPKEYLDEQGVDLRAEAVRMVDECEWELRRAVLDGTLEGAGADEVAQVLASTYRFVLLDERDDAVEHVPRPTIAWDATR